MADKEQKIREAEPESASAEGRRDRLDSATADASPKAAPQAKKPADKSADKDGSPGRKLNRREILARLMGKSETILELTAENHALKAELAELKDRWIRTAAEFENYRKRTRKEWELLKQQSKAEVILEILGVVDDFERAFSVVDGSDSGEFAQGIRLIHTNFVQVLEKLGIREVAALHEPFDPNFHMAVGQIERDDVDSGNVAEVVEKGFYLDDTVIRPAKVIVTK